MFQGKDERAPPSPSRQLDRRAQMLQMRQEARGVLRLVFLCQPREKGSQRRRSRKGRMSGAWRSMFLWEIRSLYGHVKEQDPKDVPYDSLEANHRDRKST